MADTHIPDFCPASGYHSSRQDCICSICSGWLCWMFSASCQSLGRSESEIMCLEDMIAP